MATIEQQIEEAIQLNGLRMSLDQGSGSAATERALRKEYQELGGDKRLEELLAIPEVLSTLSQKQGFWDILPTRAGVVKFGRELGTAAAIGYGGTALMEGAGITGGLGAGATGATEAGAAGAAGTAGAAATGGEALAGTGYSLGAGEVGAGAAGTSGAAGAAGATGAAGGSSLLGGALEGVGTKELIGAGLSTAGTILGGEQAKEAAAETAGATIEGAKLAAEAQKFRPVGVTTRFGESKFGYDEQGNLISAGYELSPELRAQQDILMGASGDYLKQYQGAMGATAPMGEGAQTMMGLGQQYLAKSPEEQAAMYMEQQRALLAGGQERSLAGIQSRLQAQGRGGLAIGGTSTGLRASNPELDAYYNALAQQELALAAQATQGGMDYAKFGAGMLGGGGQMLQNMYGTQQAAYQPYATALGGATSVEQLGQQPLEMGVNIGAQSTAGQAAAGEILGQGITQAAQTTQETRSQSPWADILTGAGRYILS